MDLQSKNQFIKDAENIAPFFEVEISIRILGKTILHYVFPPKKN